MREQFTVRAHVRGEVDVWFYVSNAGNSCDLFQARIVEDARCSSIGPAAVVASFTFISGTRGTIESGKVAESATEDQNLVEEVERFETLQHVALQAKTKRDHGHDHCGADDDAHSRENRAQFCLPQISKR